MDSIRRLDRALAQMTASNIRANQHAIGDFNDLVHTGRRNLEECFRSIVAELCKPIEPAHHITKREHSPYWSGQ